MGTHQDHAPGATHEALPHDPENDIDARSSTLWVVGGTIVTFLCLWIMLPIFQRVQEEERRRKVDLLAPTERLDVMEVQREFLGGANPKSRKIEQAMQDVVAGK
jgi:beta-lactamase regulating signal transducer with metallopeptidase domain